MLCIAGRAAPWAYAWGLTAEIRRVIAASPFHGEGHRKIWARLRVDGVRTSKRRVLRLLRVADLLGPARVPAAAVPHPHDGTIIPDAPNVMWGTDATLSVTLADGQVTIFGAIDHYTAECIGLHAAKPGTRFEAWNRCGKASAITSAAWSPTPPSASPSATTTAVNT